MEMSMMYCENGKYKIEHDGRKWEPGELEEHIRSNRHEPIRISFAAPDVVRYAEMKKIAEGIEGIFTNSHSQNKRAINSK